MHYTGTLDNLKEKTDAINLVGSWDHNEATGKHSFRAKSGEILNWWPSKGTLQFQGKNTDKFMTELLKSLSEEPPVASVAKATTPQKIFIVHGHDQEAREQLELTLMKLGLAPFILQNVDGGGGTIIESLEQSIYKESALGIVLMTPDDFGYSKSQTDAEKQPRARQNVVLELGMIMAALTRKKTVIVRKRGPLEMPSDTMGILYCEYDKHIKEIVPKLAQRLGELGFTIDPGHIAHAAS